MSDEQEWFYTDSGGVEHGPVSADELRELAVNGAIHDLTDVWTEGLDEWLPASQVEGLMPTTASTVEPAHEPHINLGPSTGVLLGSTITPKAMADPHDPSSPNPYAHVNKTNNSKTGWIVFAVIAAILIGVGTYFAMQSSSETKPEDIPGFVEYSKANELIQRKKNSLILGNDSDALEISKAFFTAIKNHKDPAIEESFPGLLAKEGEIRTYTKVRSVNEEKSVLVIVEVLKMKLINQKAQQAMADAAWRYTQNAVAHSPYNGPETQLAVALRDASNYFKVMIGHPVAAEATTTNPTAGIEQSHEEGNLEARLYPFFVEPEKDQ